MAELRIERTFNAPIQKVWDAWTTKEMIRQWSCPESFEVTELGADFRVGGEWYMTMISKKMGYTGKLRGEYRIIEEPSKLQSTHTWIDDSGNSGQETIYTVELTEDAEKTHMVFTQTGLVSDESRDSHAEGWNETFNKLDTLVKEQQ